MKLIKLSKDHYLSIDFISEVLRKDGVIIIRMKDGSIHRMTEQTVSHFDKMMNTINHSYGA